jgi:hypothetical protein
MPPRFSFNTHLTSSSVNAPSAHLEHYTAYWRVFFFFGEFWPHGKQKRSTATHTKYFLKKMCQRCQSLDQFFSDIAIFRQQVPVSCLNIGMIFEFFYIPLRPCTQIWVNSSCGCLIHKVENKKSLACIIIIISFWSTLKLSLKWPSLHHVFLGLLSRHIPTRFPSFSGIRKVKTF